MCMARTVLTHSSCTGRHTAAMCGTHSTSPQQHTHSFTTDSAQPGLPAMPCCAVLCCAMLCQVDLSDSCVLTLSGAWQGQLGWDGWGVSGSSSSSVRDLVEAAVDKVRWWAEQCDRMQGAHTCDVYCIVAGEVTL